MTDELAASKIDGVAAPAPTSLNSTFGADFPVKHKEDKQAHTGLGADWISLAAAPTFAIMALIAGVPGGGPPDVLCSAARHVFPLSGMVPMYLLMSAFHSAPWLKLIVSWRSDAHRSPQLAPVSRRSRDTS